MQTSRVFKYSVLKLIELVKARPVIWDSTRPDFRTIGGKQRAWEEIYEILDDKYNSSNESTKTDIGVKIVSKWRNIRDAFIRSFRKRATKRNVKQYMYHKELSFMLKLINEETSHEHQSESSISNDGTVVTISLSDIKSEPIDELSDYDDPVSASLKVELDEEKLSNPETFRNLKRRNEDENSIGSKVQKVEAPKDPIEQVTSLCRTTTVEQGTNTIPTSPDEDESFFASILSLVRNMTADEKLEFRMVVLRHIQETRLKRCMITTNN